MSKRRNPAAERPSMLYAVTASVTARSFLKGQMSHMSERARVTLVVGDSVPADLAADEGVAAFSLGLPRDPSPVSDVAALVKLVRLVLSDRPKVAVFGTPKMGLLAALATWMCRVPRRVYVVHGLRWEGSHGWRRWVLRNLDGIAFRLSTDVVAVSDSVREKAVREMGLSSSKSVVLRHGSANGIDIERFRPLRGRERELAREVLGISADAVLYTFTGRLTYDKGIHQLPECWTQIASRVPTSQLVVVGQPEPANPGDSMAIDALRAMETVRVLPAAPGIEHILGAADVNLSLSRREGMPTVILEAAACEVPTVAYAVTGAVDAVQAGTGELVQLDSLASVVDRAVRYGNDPHVRGAAGRTARSRVARDFRPEDLWNEWERFLFDPSGGRR